MTHFTKSTKIKTRRGVPLISVKLWQLQSTIYTDQDEKISKKNDEPHRKEKKINKESDQKLVATSNY